MVINAAQVIVWKAQGFFIARLCSRSPSAISLNQWHAVRVSRSMRHGELTVDSGEVVHGQSPVSTLLIASHSFTAVLKLHEFALLQKAVAAGKDKV